MLAQRRRRWANIKPASVQYLCLFDCEDRLSQFNYQEYIALGATRLNRTQPIMDIMRIQ